MSGRGRHCSGMSAAQRSIRAVALKWGWTLAGAALLMVLWGRVEGADWRWSHPEPHGNNIADLAFRDGWYVQVTDRGGLYVSTNRLVWDRLESGTLKDLRSAAFLGARLVVTGAEGLALWTDDFRTVNSAPVVPTTVDWLEGVAAGPDRAVAVGDNGAIFRSTDGKSWERVAAGQFSQWLRGVGYGAGVFVAVGEDGFVASSPDGLTWTRRTSGVNTALNRVTFGNSQFVVAGDAGVVLLSANGQTWTADSRNGLASTVLASVVTSPGERLVAGDAALAIRKPPVSWQNQLLASGSPSPAPEWNYAAAAWDGVRYLVGGRTGVLIESFRTNAIGLSDETFWFRNDDSPRNWLWDVERLGGTYVAVGDRGTVLTSPSGIGWTLESVPDAAVDKVLFGIGGSDAMALAVGDDGMMLSSVGSTTNVVTGYPVVAGGRTNIITVTNQISLMGLIWNEIKPRPANVTLQGVAWNGVEYLVAGAEGTVLRSTNASAWVRSPVPGNEFLTSAASVGAGWVVTGSRGAIYTSPDGAAWTRRNSGTTNWVYRVAAIPGGWVAVGQSGLVLTSTNAIDWTARASGTPAWLTSVRRCGDAIYAAGTQGVVLRSTNAVDWVAVPSLTGKSLYGVAVSGGQVVVAGAEGVILRRWMEPTATPIRIANYRHFRDAEPWVEGLVFQGGPEQPTRWEDSDSVGNWSPVKDLELNVDGLGIEGAEIQRPARIHRGRGLP